ncbi:ABC transporter ATP-binding protein [Bosea rubneri]|uniref:Spermidine/putrescine import ATP-binding protein PotA n=1 Tax=Bosea rubneri TaxID=3075434 RepID=A0ABU3SDN1_9HYPH|nr:ABC transporter ATP-binding protein [Bosea sp. ZW T0_25]MDU0342872.1 ABC transporter ATP-binding protein [Bosea sp. ZW T0_25]
MTDLTLQQNAGTPPKLVVSGLHKTYGATVALHPTDLTLRSGEFMTLLGPSGSGKTTLLMMVAGLLQADGGELSIDGHKATYAPPWERGIGMVFQNYALFPHLTVFENIAFPLRMRRMPEAEIRREVARVLEIVQLPHTAQRQPRALSGGQQQRIALARCFVFKPSFILMDEPLGALDKKLRDQLQLEIKHLHKSLGITILYVTHDQEEALTMSDRICLMNGGRIEQLGTPAELYFEPATVFAADFLGESNFLEGKVRSNSPDGLVIDAVGGAISGAGNFAAGSAVKVMVRPESVRAALKPVEGWNAVPGTVRETIFVGGVTRHYIELAEGGTVVALELTDRRTQPADPGREVFATWPVSATVVLAAEKGKMP